MTRVLRRRKQLSVPYDANNTFTIEMEYAYYAYLLYSILGRALGLSASFLGVGILTLLAGLCVRRLKGQAFTFYAPIAPAMWCAFSFVTIQVGLHGESIMGDSVRLFVTWIPTLILLYSISLRKGFLHRFALVVFGIGLSALPYLQYESSGSVERAALNREVSGVLAGANGLAAWFGFCALFFILKAIETIRLLDRALSSLAAIVCLFVVAFTVSRGVLVSVAISLVLAFQRSLRRAFLPVLFLTILLAIALTTGLLDSIITSYSERGAEETGRLLVWPVAIERFLASPIFGVGLANVGSDIGSGRLISPHNSFLFIGIASGVIPLGFFVAYWSRAFSGAFRSYAKRAPYGLFCMPLTCYAFMVSFASNVPFMVPWAVATLSVAIGSGVRRLNQAHHHQNKINRTATNEKVRNRILPHMLPKR